MHKLLFIVAFLFIATLSIAQGQSLTFEYDSAGNRVKRMITLERVPLKSTHDSASKLDPNIAKDELSKIEDKYSFENLEEGQIKVFPNPTEGDIMIRLENISITGDITANLYSPSGRLLQSRTINSDYYAFNLEGFSPGLYILRINHNDERKEYKIMKK